MNNFLKPIHILYVPTMHCNMGCKYCYLGTDTNVKKDEKEALSTLKLSIESMLSEGYLPYNISFHGGEVTTLSEKTLIELFEYTKNYYKTYDLELQSFGFKIKPLHIKTNMLNFDKLYNLFDSYKVSISGSVDLPLSLHSKYRTYKNGKSTLSQIIQNLKLLSTYSHNKKISCVVTKVHLKNIKEFCDDIWFIHKEIGLDMNNFNIMFGFENHKSREKFNEQDEELLMLNYQEQLEFYENINNVFKDTELDYGLKNYWFEEFTPSYCCSAKNCGEKMFLIQSNGDVYSCPRGQGNKNYKYGNILKQNAKEIILNAKHTIGYNENKLNISSDCLKCNYLPYCNVGCTFVREETKIDKSYTCKVQKELYRSNIEQYPPYTDEEIIEYSKQLLKENNFKQYIEEGKNMQHITFNITPEITEQKNSLRTIIQRDKKLEMIYDKSNFKISVNKHLIELESQILKTQSKIENIHENDQILLYAKKDIFEKANENNENNYINLKFLRDTKVTYGDEGRIKQEHTFDYSIYMQTFINGSQLVEDYYIYDLTNLFALIKDSFQENVLNNLFVTTKALSNYHYKKHQNNAFYHIQAINLPFSNIEFFYEKDIK